MPCPKLSHRVFFRSRVIAPALLLLASPAILAAGPSASRKADFPDSAKVATISVAVTGMPSGSVVRTISIHDRNQVAEVLAALAKFREEWSKVYLTPPAGLVAIHLLSDAPNAWPLCTVRMGAGWITTDIDGHVHTRKISSNDQDALLKSLGLSSSVLAASGEKQAEHTSNKEEWKHTEQRGENKIQISSRWKDIVGHRVAVEGLLWDSGKGLDPQVLLHGGLVYLEWNRFTGMQDNGKPVRVVGKLTLRHIKKVPPNVQGYEYDFDAFIVKPDEVKVLDRVIWPWMEDLGTKK